MRPQVISVPPVSPGGEAATAAKQVTNPSATAVAYEGTSTRPLRRPVVEEQLIRPVAPAGDETESRAADGRSEEISAFRRYWSWFFYRAALTAALISRACVVGLRPYSAACPMAANGGQVGRGCGVRRCCSADAPSAGEPAWCCKAHLPWIPAGVESGRIGS